jgi:catechol 2,3-dioxygenase-like lactoylglutathione lyase family enzyme
MPRRSGPAIFRLLLPARDLARSRAFYETLLGVKGRSVAPGRIYFECSGVILGILDYSRVRRADWPRVTESMYFAVGNLEAVFRRAKKLECLSGGLLHGDRASPLGKIRVRPWGERSFYAEDPSGNALCFVDRSTLFTGTRAQIAALDRAMARG